MSYIYFVGSLDLYYQLRQVTIKFVKSAKAGDKYFLLIRPACFQTIFLCRVVQTLTYNSVECSCGISDK